ncbi:MAG: DMT family transporter [Clostridia bacterium]|nr:DMT family transporter [Clostridia bacterium]
MEKKSIYSNKIVFVLLALCATALWGTAFPGIKKGYEWFGIDDTGSVILFAGLRFFIAGVIVLAVYAVKNKKLPALKKSEIKTILVLSFLQVAGNYFFYYLGLAKTPGSIASVLNSFDSFAIVLVASRFFKNDKLTARKIIGCVIGIAGIIIINFRGGENFAFRLTGEGFLLISALFSTLAMIVIKKATETIDPVITTGYYLLIGGTALIAVALLLGGKISFSSVKADACLLYLALVSALAFMIWTTLLKHNDASRLGGFKLMTPIFGNAFSAIILHENIFTPAHLLSVLLVAAGIATVNTEGGLHNKVGSHGADKTD